MPCLFMFWRKVICKHIQLKMQQLCRFEAASIYRCAYSNILWWTVSWRQMQTHSYMSDHRTFGRLKQLSVLNEPYPTNVAPNQPWAFSSSNKSHSNRISKILKATRHRANIVSCVCDFKTTYGYIKELYLHMTLILLWVMSTLHWVEAVISWPLQLLLWESLLFVGLANWIQQDRSRGYLADFQPPGTTMLL